MHLWRKDTQTCETYVLLQAQQTYAGMVHVIDMWTLHKGDKNDKTKTT